MKSDTVRGVLAERPFRALRIRMVSGEQYTLTHPEQIAFLPEPRVVVIGAREVGFHILAIELIEGIEKDVRNGRSTGRARRRRR